MYLSFNLFTLKPRGVVFKTALSQSKTSENGSKSLASCPGSMTRMGMMPNLKEKVLLKIITNLKINFTT